MEKNTLQLSGFDAIERFDATALVNKFVGRITRHVGTFDEMLVNKKDIHKQGNHGAIEISINLVSGAKRLHAHAEGHTLSDVITEALTSIESAASKNKA